MAFIGIIVLTFGVFLMAWQYDAKKCHAKGWNINFAGQCYDDDGYLRKP